MVGVGEGECKGCNLEDESLTLMRCHNYGLQQQLYKALEGLKSNCGQAYNKAIKGKICYSSV